MPRREVVRRRRPNSRFERSDNCGLNKGATVQLFNVLQKTEQYKHVEFAL